MLANLRLLLYKINCSAVARSSLLYNLAAVDDVDAFGQGRWVGAQVATIEGVDGAIVLGLGGG